MESSLKSWLAIGLLTLAGMLIACGDRSKSADQRAVDHSAGQPSNPAPDQPLENSASETRQDVAAAQENARVARAQTDAAADVVEAESAHRVAIAKCEALSGSARTDCIARADRQLERVKAEAKQELDQKVPPQPQ
jgi:hypothetical protein